MKNILTSLELLICFIDIFLCYDHPTPRVYDKAHMHGLAIRIRSKILQPFGSGGDLLQDMRNYLKELEDLKKGIGDENAEATNAFDRLQNQGGPQHLQIKPVDTKPLVAFYKWDNRTTDVFSDLFDQTLLRWVDLRTMAVVDKAVKRVESGYYYNQSDSSEFHDSGSSRSGA